MKLYLIATLDSHEYFGLWETKEECHKYAVEHGFRSYVIETFRKGITPKYVEEAMGLNRN